MTSNIVINGVTRYTSTSLSGTSSQIKPSKQFTSSTNKTLSTQYVHIDALSFTPTVFWMYSWNADSSADTYQFGTDDTRFDVGNPWLGGESGAQRHIIKAIMSKSGFDCPVLYNATNWIFKAYGTY